jgi:hypothetical protein
MLKHFGLYSFKQYPLASREKSQVNAFDVCGVFVKNKHNDFKTDISGCYHVDGLEKVKKLPPQKCFSPSGVKKGSTWPAGLPITKFPTKSLHRIPPKIAK